MFTDVHPRKLCNEKHHLPTTYVPSGHVSFPGSMIDEYLYRLFMDIYIYICMLYRMLRQKDVDGSTLGCRMH